MLRLLIVFFLFSCRLNAQKVFSLEECIEIAFRQSPDLQLQNLNILQASENYRFSKKSIYPTVSANLSQGINGGRSIDPFSNTFIQRTINSNSLGLGTNWTVFNGFSTKNQIELNKNSVEVEKFQLEFRRKELKINVISAYLQVLVSQELLKISQEQRKDLEFQLQVLKEKVKEGLLAQSQIAEFEAQLANQVFEEYSAKNNLELARLNLSQRLGFSSKTDFEVKFHKKIIPKSWETNILHPAQKVLEARLIGAKLGSTIAKAAKYPTVSISGGLGSAYSSAASLEYSYFNQLNYNLNQFFRVGMIIPIYNNGQVQARIETANIQEQIVKKEMDQQKLKLGQEFEKQKMEIALLTERIKFGEINLSAQNKTYAAAKERFSEGLINSVELNILRMNAERVKITQIQMQIELNYKALMLETFLE